jgi:hypothetical protein
MIEAEHIRIVQCATCFGIDHGKGLVAADTGSQAQGRVGLATSRATREANYQAYLFADRGFELKTHDAALS